MLDQVQHISDTDADSGLTFIFSTSGSGSSLETDHKRSDSVDQKQNPEEYARNRILHKIGLHQSRKNSSVAKQCTVQLFNRVFPQKIW